jgi:hypothetical protein
MAETITSPASETEDKAAALSPTETTELCYLTPADLAFHKHGAHIRLTVKDDRSYLKVSMVRIFPLSEPGRYISIRSGDNKEAGVLVDPSELPAEARALVAEALERRYLVAIIRRIARIKERFGTLEWDVETDRGPVQFTTRNLRENSTRPSPGRYLISDVDGNRYDLPDLAALDLASQTLIMKYL